MIGRVNTGGGSGLNMRVFGGSTAPTNPKENDIWIQTNSNVFEWSFVASGASVTNRAGRVWIKMGNGNTNEFQILRESTPAKQVWLSPVGCVVGDGSSWKSLNAYLYKSSKWTQFSKVFAATINITYPAGSTCTVTDGVTTYTAPDTSGTWACIVNNTGTWTVTSTNGSQTKSASVSITADGQTQSVTLQYFTATINITYPAGSTCKVTIGSTVQWAPDTSGHWACTVFSTGTYTVQSTLGSQSASQNVTITASGQSVSVALTYEYYIVNGSGNVDYTGGWKLLAYSDKNAANKNNIKMYTESGWTGVQAYSTSPVDLSKFSKLHINVSAYNNARPEAAFGVNRNKPNHIMWNGRNFDDDTLDHNFTNKTSCAARVGITSTGVKTIDISGLSGSYYLWTGEDGATWDGAGYTIDKVWLS